MSTEPMETDEAVRALLLLMPRLVGRAKRLPVPEELREFALGPRHLSLLSYLLLDGHRELGVFTGGSLIVGSAARTDLLGPDRAEELARYQYRSLRRLAMLPGDTAVWPTHGAGSFCSAPAGELRTSTIAAQKAANRLLGTPDEETFVRLLLDSLGSYPAYFGRLAEENRRGPALLTDDPGLAPLGVAPVRHLLAQGARLVDVRPVTEFAAGHIPGAVHVELGSVKDAALPRREPLTVMCGHGERAMSAASILQARGQQEWAVVLGGPSDWARSSGRALEIGP